MPEQFAYSTFCCKKDITEIYLRTMIGGIKFLYTPTITLFPRWDSHFIRSITFTDVYKENDLQKKMDCIKDYGHPYYIEMNRHRWGNDEGRRISLENIDENVLVEIDDSKRGIKSLKKLLDEIFIPRGQEIAVGQIDLGAAKYHRR